MMIERTIADIKCPVCGREVNLHVYDWQEPGQHHYTARLTCGNYDHTVEIYSDAGTQKAAVADVKRKWKRYIKREESNG